MELCTSEEECRLGRLRGWVGLGGSGVGAGLCVLCGIHFRDEGETGGFNGHVVEVASLKYGDYARFGVYDNEVLACISALSQIYHRLALSCPASSYIMPLSSATLALLRLILSIDSSTSACRELRTMKLCAGLSQQ